MPTDRFSDLKSLAATRKPGHTLPGSFYTSQSVFEMDLDVIFARHWIFVAVEPDIPDAGDFLTVELGRNSILLVRGDEGTIHGLHNVCRHRGARLVDDERGMSASFVCPYHQWTYDLDGKLIHATHMGSDFDPACHGLTRVHVRSLEGLIFICLAEEPPTDFDAMAAVVGPRISPHDLKNCKIAKQIDLIEDGNWKLSMENNRECYHCGGNHPELLASLPAYTFGYNADPNDVKGRAAADAYVAEACQTVARWEACGFGSAPVEKLTGCATGFRTERLLLGGTGESFTLDTKSACRKLLGNLTDPRLGDLHVWLQPNSWHHFMADHIITFAAIPLSPGRTRVRTTWLVHRDAVEGVDYDLDRLTEVWTATNAQDAALVARAQQGVESAGYRPGPYSPITETFVDDFCTWYMERLAAHGVAAG
jgi:Rieske 2Fe-2S family protein